MYAFVYIGIHLYGFFKDIKDVKVFSDVHKKRPQGDDAPRPCIGLYLS